MQLGNGGFIDPKVTVRFTPRQDPLRWIRSIARKDRETVTFEANLPCPPAFNLEVHNQHWMGKSGRKLLRKMSVMRMKRVGPFVLTSRREWERDITGMMHGLAASRDCELMSVAFRRRAPHFSATIPLEVLAEQGWTEVRFFDVLRELAAGASAARF